MGSTKKVTVEQKLASLLSYICEREGYNPDTLEKSEGSSYIFDKNVTDMEALRDTISYLKDFAKLQAIAKGLSDREGLEKDVESAQADFQKIIEEKEAEIRNLPRVTRKKVGANVYEFQAEMEEKAQREYEAALEARRAKVASLQQDIRLYKSKIRKMDRIKKSVDNPDKLMELLLPDEYTNVKENYARLVNLCVASMTDGYKKKDLIGDDKVFKFDGKNYTVNYNNARKFISAIKSKKEILAAGEYIKAKQIHSSAEHEYRHAVEDQEKYEEAQKIIGTKEFAYVTYEMNQLIGQFNRLKEAENRSRRGNAFTRFGNRLKELLGLPIRWKIPEKIWDARYELAENMKKLSLELKQDEAKMKAYMAYQVTTKGAGNTIGIRELDWTAPLIEQDGVRRANFPRKKATVDILKLELSKRKTKADNEVKKLENEKAEAEAREGELFTSLNSKSKKILETQGEKNIMDYIQTYYKTEKDDRRRTHSEYMSPSSAAIILESILGRKHISWENIAESYAGILGEHKLAAEKISIEEAINKKVDSLKNRLMSQPKEAEQVR